MVAVLANALGLWIAATYVPGFHLSLEIKSVVVIAIVLTALNIVLKPILKLILGPIIVLTLGLGLLVVNGLLLYVLDIIVQSLTIETFVSLAYATLLFSVINFVFHFATKKD